MKFAHFAATFVVLCFCVTARTAEIATIAGFPNGAVLPYFHVELVGYSTVDFESDYTTYLYSILGDHGLSSAVAYDVLNSKGLALPSEVKRAVEDSSHAATVVLSVVGGDQRNEICRLMSLHTNVAYVLADRHVDAEQAPACLARNILFVAGLNQALSDLAAYSGSGLAYRVAAPSFQVPGFNANGQAIRLSGLTAAAAIVAAGLAIGAEASPGVTGAKLIEQYFAARTVHFPSLDGKVENGRAVIH